MTNIKISNLTHHYGSQSALKEISFQLHSGLTMLLGPNGAGKSTILNLLSGLIKTQKGSIIFDPNLKNINRMIGCVFQQPSLDPELTCRQNLNYHMALHGQTLDKNNDFINELLLELKLSELMSKKVKELNGGHKRRIEIIRALLHNPKILLLDEPTAGLDIHSRAIICKAIRLICQKTNMLVLWCTHLMDEIHDTDTILILNKGELVSQGMAHTLCKQHHSPSLNHLFYQLTKTDVLL